MKKLVIFDWDGTLFDSISIIQRSLQRSFDDLRLTVPSDEEAKHVIGLGVEDALQYLCPGLSDFQATRLALRYRHHYLNLEKDASLFAGVFEALEKLMNSNSILAVATGKSRKGLERAFDSTKTRNLFHLSRTADETSSKPDPKMLNEILVESRIEIDDAVMIGDTIFDIEMARAIGMSNIAVTYGAHSTEKLKGQNPDSLVASIDELYARLTS